MSYILQNVNCILASAIFRPDAIPCKEMLQTYNRNLYVYFESSQWIVHLSVLILSSPSTNEQFADLRPPGARSVPPRGPLPPARVDQDVLAGEVVVQALGGRSLSD